MQRSVLFIDNGGHSIKALFLPASFSQHYDNTTTLTHPDKKNSSSSPSSTPSVVSPGAAPSVYIIPNCIGAAPHAGTGIVGDQLTSLPHYNGVMLRRPVDRGFVVDGALQTKIWEHILQHFAIERELDVDVWLTVPFAVPKSVAQLLFLLCTRSFRFGSVTLVSASWLSLIAHSFSYCFFQGSDDVFVRHPLRQLEGDRRAVSTSGSRKRARKDSNEAHQESANGERSDDGGMCDRCCGEEKVRGTAIVVDVGFSGSTVVPYIDFLPVLSSSVRLDIGGKVLTNRLKEVLSYRQVNVMEDTWLINHVKERCCVVARQPWRSLEQWAALWAGKSREEMEAALDELNITAAASTDRNVLAVSRTKATLSQVFNPQRKEGDVAVRAEHAATMPRGGGEEGWEDLEDAPVHSPVRFYLPTIPTLLPLGVVESELPLRLPKTTAIDAAALQHVLLCQERFLIPELLFTPGDVGVDQQGLSQAITHGIFQRGLLQHVVTLLKPQLLRRVCVFGGTAALPQLCARLNADVRASSAVLSGDDTTEFTVDSTSPLQNERVTRSSEQCGSGDVRSRTTHYSERCVESSPVLPDFMKAAAEASNTAKLAMLPLLGAYTLLTAVDKQNGVLHGTSSRNPNDQKKSGAETSSEHASGDAIWTARLVQLRALVQQRSCIELQHPANGRVTVETFQEALQRVL